MIFSARVYVVLLQKVRNLRFWKNILKVGMNPAYEFTAVGDFLTGLQGIADRSGTRI